jgi:long-chain acyl-CoA synthetase
VDYDDPILKSFEAVRAAGQEFGAAHPGYVEAAIEAGRPDDLTLFSYTSGTTSRPKGVMLSHANLLSPGEAFATAEGLRASDEHLAYLPMAWVGNSLFSLALHLWIAFTCNFPEKPETLQRDLRELGPTIGLAPPRFWENMLTTITVRAADSGPLKRWIFSTFRGVAERAERCVAEGGRCRSRCASPAPSARYWSTDRCATSWGCVARGWSIPAARRSAPTSSASSARSAST